MLVNRSSTYEKKGIKLFDEYKYFAAIKDLDKAIELNPQHYYPWGLRGQSKFYLGQYEEAIKDFDRAIELNSNKSVSLFYNRGSCKYKLNDYKGVIEDYSSCIQLNTISSNEIDVQNRAKKLLESLRLEE